MHPAAVECTFEILLRQQLELEGNLRRLQDALAETQGLVHSLARMQINLLARQNEIREEMDRRFAETDEQMRRPAPLIVRGFYGGDGARPGPTLPPQPC